MAKVNQGYPNLLGGVSEQAPELRKTNQHWEQVNMLADEKVGLTRRPGSRRVAELASGTPASHALPTTSGTRAYDFRVRGTDYSLIAPFAGNTQSRGSWPAFSCLKKDPGVAGGSLLPVTFVGNATRYAALQSAGIAASTSVGSVLVMACTHASALPTYTTSYDWQTEENLKRHIIWIRGGAYSRTFRMALVRGNQKFIVEYTTRSASYPEVLDTSDLIPTDPDYLKKVNDRTNAYNTAATQWIGAALADATPENVAAKLAQALTDADFLAPAGTVQVIGSTICITDTSVDDVEVDDGGDNSLMRGVGNTVSAPELLSTLAFPGKIARIRPNADTEGNVFFMKAVAKDGSSGAFTAVSWEESPGIKFTPTEGLFFATVVSDVCYVATSPASLRTATGIDFPDYIPSVCGDDVTSPVPNWLIEGITYLGMFQDRLVIGGRNEVATSRPGDYLNFWRGSVLTVAKNDPVRFIIIGGEDDILRHSVIYDRNLVIFGDKRQYIVDGRKPFEPNTSSATILAEFPDAVHCPPVIAGKYMFFARSTDGVATLHQLAPGRIAESPEQEELSANLAGYLNGNPIEIVSGTLPNSIYVRTDAEPNSIFVYSYVDADERRASGAWQRWEYHAKVGPITGMTLANGFLYLTAWRNSTPGTGYVVADRQPLYNDGIAHPYLDSATARGPISRDVADDPEVGQAAFTSVWHAATIPSLGYAAAYGRAGGFVGTTDTASATLLAHSSESVWEGFLQAGCVTLTSPYFRDSVGAAIQAGRLTVGNVTLAMRDVGGVAVSVHTGSGHPCWLETLHGLYDPEPVDYDEYRVGPPIPPPPPPPPPELRSIGWIDPITNPFEPFTVAHANTGTASYFFDGERYAASVVDYAGETVVWVPVWTPVGSDPAPLVYGSGPGWVMYRFDHPTEPWRPIEGMLSLTATVNGVATDEIIFTCGEGDYATMAWGPAP